MYKYGADLEKPGVFKRFGTWVGDKAKALFSKDTSKEGELNLPSAWGRWAPAIIGAHVGAGLGIGAIPVFGGKFKPSTIITMGLLGAAGGAGVGTLAAAVQDSREYKTDLADNIILRFGLDPNGAAAKGVRAIIPSEATMKMAPWGIATTAGVTIGARLALLARQLMAKTPNLGFGKALWRVIKSQGGKVITKHPTKLGLAGLGLTALIWNLSSH